jgi:hypothetical protein
MDDGCHNCRASTLNTYLCLLNVVLQCSLQLAKSVARKVEHSFASGPCYLQSTKKYKYRVYVCNNGCNFTN